MDLEKRVEMLEQELQVLKNQIQGTLLDIQEQILTNAYPVLRGEDMPMPGTQQNVPSQPVKTISIPSQAQPDSHDAAQDDSAPIPAMRRVSLNDLQNDRQQDTHYATPMPGTPPPAQTDWDALPQLEEWTVSKIEQMGVKRTRELIRVYTEKGRFTPEIQDTLLQFVSLYGGKVPAPKAHSSVPTRPAQPQQVALRQTSNDSRNGASQGQAARSQDKTRRRKRPATPAAAPEPQSYVSKLPAKERPAPPPREHQPRQQQNADVNGEEDDGSQSTILKLIAGVASAGMNKWGKK